MTSGLRLEIKGPVVGLPQAPDSTVLPESPLPPMEHSGATTGQRPAQKQQNTATLYPTHGVGLLNVEPLEEASTHGTGEAGQERKHIMTWETKHMKNTVR